MDSSAIPTAIENRQQHIAKTIARNMNNQCINMFRRIPFEDLVITAKQYPVSPKFAPKSVQDFIAWKNVAGRKFPDYLHQNGLNEQGFQELERVRSLSPTDLD